MLFLSTLRVMVNGASLMTTLSRDAPNKKLLIITLEGMKMILRSNTVLTRTCWFILGIRKLVRLYFSHFLYLLSSKLTKLSTVTLVEDVLQPVSESDIPEQLAERLQEEK